MMHIIPKWRVTFGFAGADPLTIFMADNFAANVLRKAADIDFGFDKPVQSVMVSREPDNPQNGLTSTSIVTRAPTPGRE